MKSIRLRMEESLRSVGLVDSIGWSKGFALVRKSFFYTFGYGPQKYAIDIEENLNAAKLTGYSGEPLRFRVVECKEIWKPFVGGQPVSRQSHWLAKVEVLYQCEKCNDWGESSYKCDKCGFNIAKEA